MFAYRLLSIILKVALIYSCKHISFHVHDYFSLLSIQSMYRCLVYIQLTLMFVNSNYLFFLDIRVSCPSFSLLYKVCSPVSSLQRRPLCVQVQFIKLSLFLGQQTYDFGFHMLRALNSVSYSSSLLSLISTLIRVASYQTHQPYDIYMWLDGLQQHYI